MIGDGITRLGRSFAERLMTTQCTVTRTLGKPSLNNDGTYSSVTTTVYTGPCRVRFVSNAVSEVDLQAQELVKQNAILSLPVNLSTTSVRTGDVALITANALDPGLNGRRFRISGIHAQTHATARRFTVELVS